MSESALPSSISITEDQPTTLPQLLNPRAFTPHYLIAIGLGAVVGFIGMQRFGWPLWLSSAIILAILLISISLKSRTDLKRYGLTVALLGALLTVQGFHTIEHIAQWVQYHLLFWSMRQSSGLISPANAEWVHFVWNWGVLLAVLILVRGGLRNIWAGFLLGVALAHTIEHTYTFIRYFIVLQELRELGVTNVTAQGLPGILGRDGWLARSAWTQGTILCSIPGLTTAIRLDVHFWWNVLEMSLLALAGSVFLRRTNNHQPKIDDGGRKTEDRPVFAH